jgi:protein TonB
LSKVDPVLVGPRFLTVPVRIIIGTDGRIKHTHVILAFPEQQRSIEDAMAQWAFKPYLVDGKPVEIETGLMFEFKPAAR